ncbi:MAG: T9SS type A sorting domain-containing protein [Candidatus Aegiribacteria sp.]|nr:T9SS type A sorting domain-containing protein [Candidatus Aegiribacteria sp.]
MSDFVFWRSNGTNNNSFVAYINENGEGTDWSSGTVYSWYQTYGITTNVADMDSDGDFDLAVGFREPTVFQDDMHYEIVWIENNGTTSNWNEHVVLDYSGPYNRHLLDVIDIDMDGDGDILAHIGYPPNVTVLFNNTNGAGNAWDQYTFWGGQKTIECFFDLEGDGDFDMLVNDTDIWINQGGSGSSWYNYTEPDLYGLGSHRSADIDSDGDDDLIATYNSNLYWFENVASGSQWIPHLVDSLTGGAHTITDFDSDGDLDILRFKGDTLCYYENINPSNDFWLERATLVYPDGFSRRGYADFTNDDMGDLLFLHQESGHYDFKLLERSPYERYRYSGTIESSILDSEPSTDEMIWGWLLYDCDVPFGTNIDVQVRASSNYQNMGIWSPPLESGADLSNYCLPNEHYFQYKLNLETTDSTQTPIFNEFSIAFSTSNDEGNSPLFTHLIGTVSNPTTSNSMVSFETAENTHVSLDVYDLSGRLINSLIDDDVSEGIHSVSLGELPSGVYMLRFIAPSCQNIKKMVIIE